MDKKFIKKNVKQLKMLAIVSVFIISTLLISGCTQESSDQSSNVLDIPSPPDIPEIPEGVAHGWQEIYTQLYINDFESLSYPGLQTSGEMVTEGALDGATSVKLSQYQTISTDPSVLPLSGNTYYLFEFDYKILSKGSDTIIMQFSFFPQGSTDDELAVVCYGMFDNVDLEGTYSAGALTAAASNYYLNIFSAEGTTALIDNLKLYRLDAWPITSQPSEWSDISNIPYPRLGNYFMGNTFNLARDGQALVDTPEGQLAYSKQLMEEKLAFSDIIVGCSLDEQTVDTDFCRRIQELNPNIIIIPYRLYGEQTYEIYSPPGKTVSIEEDFFDGLSDDWIVKYTNGTFVPDYSFPQLRKMNIYPDCPVINGETFNSCLLDHVINDAMASGVWDGIFFDNLFGYINHHIPNYDNPSIFNFDINNNGQRDETSAQIGDLTYDATIQFMEDLRDEVGDMELIIANQGSVPDLSLSQYLNGHLFEGITVPWYLDVLPNPSEAAWRGSLNQYFTSQQNLRTPKINIIEATGQHFRKANISISINEATRDDIDLHRLVLGTTLLGDGFYEYDLYEGRGAPYWFDEFTVDEDGVAVEDVQYKGYLGMALGDAVEIASESTVIWEEDFEDGTDIPNGLKTTDSEVYVSQTSGDVISGSNSLVIDNQDHNNYQEKILVSTNPSIVSLVSGKTYVVEFDWKILESIDDRFSITVEGSSGILDHWTLPGFVTADYGTEKFPITITSGSSIEIQFSLHSGGGKVAIDNIRITEGGAGPWRRDFENGFVLVNPINKEYTFSAAELAGDWSRTGIKRILGTQAPDVNNGQDVSGTLALQAFDAIILLADTIQAS